MQEPRVPERPADPRRSGRSIDPDGRAPPAGKRAQASGLPPRRSEALEAELAALEAMLARNAARGAESASQRRDSEEPGGNPARGRAVANTEGGAGSHPEPDSTR